MVHVHNAGPLSPGIRSIVLMVSAALLWAFLPVTFAVSGVDSFTSSAVFAVSVNAVGAGTCALLWVISRRRRLPGDVRAVIGFLRASKARRGALLLTDGLGIAISNTAFLFALSRGSDALVTLIVEAWPVLVVFTLSLFLARFTPPTRRDILAAVVTLTGVAVVALSSRGSSAGVDFVAVLAAVCAAAGQATTVIAHQRLLQDFQPENSHVWKNIILQFTRMTLATAFIFPAAWLLTGSRTPPIVFASEWVGADALLVTVVAAVVIVASAVLYSRALQTSSNSALPLVWLGIPVVSVLLLVAFGQAAFTMWVLVGALLVVGGNLVSATPARARDTAPLHADSV